MSKKSSLCYADYSEKIKDIFLFNNISRGTIIFLLIIRSLCFVFILASSSQAFASINYSIALQKNLDKADQMSVKDPSLALEFIQNLLTEQKHQLNKDAKAAIFTRLSKFHYYLGNLEDSLKFVNLFYDLKPDLTNHDGIDLLIIHGRVLSRKGDSVKAMNLYLQAESYAKETENNKLLAEAYGAISASFITNNNDSEALKYGHQAYILLKDLGDELELAYLKVQMSRSYHYIYDDEKAISLVNEAITYFQKNEYYFDELFAQDNLANIYMAMKAYDTAIPIYEHIIELSKKVEKTSLVEVAYLGLAKAFHRTKNNNKARHYFTLYQSIHQSSGDPLIQMDNLTLNASIALIDKDALLAQENIKQAEETLSRMEKDTSIFWYIRVLSLKAKLAVFNNDYQEAYQLQAEAHSLFKFYQNSERERVRSKYKVMFDTDRALLKNQVLQRDNKLDKAALINAEQQQKFQTIIISIISFLIIILFGFIFKQWQTSKTLHRLANTDGLTKLANRRYTFTYAETMISLVKKSEEGLSLITFDIDLFKQVNDTYGHAGGDVALKCIATVANDYVRSNDILGRIGGEEFLIILPNTSVQQAMVIAERIRKGIEEKELKITGNLVNITASFGVAELTNKNQKFSQLFNEADLALYQAKNNGRNRVVMAKKAE